MIIEIAIGVVGGTVAAKLIHRFFGKEVDAFFSSLIKQATKVGRGYYQLNMIGVKDRESKHYSVGRQEYKYEFGDYIRQQSKLREEKENAK